MRHTHKITKHVYLKRAGLQDLSFPANPIASDRSLPPPALFASYRAANTEWGERPTSAWLEPDHGLAVRVPALKQAKTARGHTFYRDTIVYHESELEHRVSTALQTYRNVTRIISQYPKVEYADVHGVFRHHTFDYFIELADETQIAIAVKYERKRQEMIELLELVCANGITGVNKDGSRTHGIADAVALVTNAVATHETFENAYFVLSSRNHHDENECTALYEIVRELPGTFRFGQLLVGCGPRAKRRTAIWRLIDLGLLTPLSHGRIDELTWLRCV
ncbi:hypothetical protein [Ensifer sp. Root127]|uniref:hypothetical protein n=1 Tax=Ensifer sp. Root127 TaxID=1736440 RepID=UPI00070ABA6F|nr:hypothetical protein [Ensifer sp. Root127]KQW82054.1 hypothetical protein ASD03_23335 [Ensifer sp. Root127]